MANSKINIKTISSALNAVSLKSALLVITLFCSAQTAQIAFAPNAYCERNVLEEANKFKQDGKLEKALKVLEDALKKDKKNNADVHFQYAILVETTGDLLSAKTHFQETIKLAPNSANAETARKSITDIESQLSSKESNKTGAKGARIGTVGIKVQEGGNIVKVFPNTPAAKAKIQAGDKVISADDAPAQGMSVDALVKKIRGPENSSVKLVIERQGKRTTYQIKRLSPESSNKEASKPFWFLFGSKDQG
ncbi:PDZ domain-containing protein [bacterium]|nr:PDZ domain-containing protein [bacterium]QQR56178.1 MAG: PDZ domain-containing protein [Candidatus Melainabacteria bacterium]